MMREIPREQAPPPTRLNQLRRFGLPVAICGLTLLLIVGCGNEEITPAPATATVVVPPTPVEEALMRAVTFAETDGSDGPFTLTDRLSFYQVPGVAFIAWDGNEQVSRAFGESDPEQEIAMTVDTVLAADSVLSTGTSALVIAALLSESSRDLNAPMGAQAETFGLPAGLRDRTLGQLLSHSGGIGPSRLPSEINNLDSFINGNARAQFDAGSQFRFSETGYAVVQRYFEQTYVRPYDDLAKTRLLTPLGLTSTDFGPSPSASARFDRRGRAQPERTGSIAATGLRISATDLARMLQAVQAIRRRDLTDSPITPKQLGFATTPRLAGWGMGWQLIGPRQRPVAMVAFAEDQPHFAIAFLDRPAGAVVVTNSANDGRLAREVALGVAQRFQWDFPEQVRGVNPTPGFDVLPRLVGGYELNGRRFDLQWTAGRLMLSPGAAFAELGEEPVPLLGTGTDRWILAESPYVLTFRRRAPATLIVDGILAVKVSEASEGLELHGE